MVICLDETVPEHAPCNDPVAQGIFGSDADHLAEHFPESHLVGGAAGKQRDGA